MKLIIFPTIGTNYNVPVNMDVVTNMVPTPSASTIAFVSGVTTIFTYTANNFTSVLSQIYAFLSNASQTILTVVDGAPVPVLLSVGPQYFSLANDTITITGTGFTPGMQNPVLTNPGSSPAEYDNVIHIEDAAGGTDSNGFCFQITYVSSTVITAKYLASGDADTSSPMLLYFSSRGNISNVLSVNCVA